MKVNRVEVQQSYWMYDAKYIVTSYTCVSALSHYPWCFAVICFHLLTLQTFANDCRPVAWTSPLEFPGVPSAEPFDFLPACSGDLGATTAIFISERTPGGNAGLSALLHSTLGGEWESVKNIGSLISRLFRIWDNIGEQEALDINSTGENFALVRNFAILTWQMPGALFTNLSGLRWSLWCQGENESARNWEPAPIWIDHGWNAS